MACSSMLCGGHGYAYLNMIKLKHRERNQRDVCMCMTLTYILSYFGHLNDVSSNCSTGAAVDRVALFAFRSLFILRPLCPSEFRS